MAIINRLILVVGIIVSFPVAIVLSLLSWRWGAMYLLYVSDLIIKNVEKNEK